MAALQTKWRCCAKCHVMFYNGAATRGSCPADGAQHAPIGLNFQLPYDVPEDPNAQRNWRWCSRCLVLFWEPAATQVCNLGGRHAAEGVVFSLPHGLPETGDAQSGWRFCAKCAVVFWEPAPVSHCSAGGEHGPAGVTFTLPHRADHVFDSGPISSALPLRGWAQLTARPDGAWTLSTHAHDSGADTIEYALAVMLVNRFGSSFAFAHTGRVEGTTAALPFGTPRRNDDQTSTGVDTRLRDQYDSVADADLQCELTGRDKLLGGVQTWAAELVDQALPGLGTTEEIAVLETA